MIELQRSADKWGGWFLSELCLAAEWIGSSLLAEWATEEWVG